ncbi:TonB-dependent receptor [Phenylobacterium sp.]|uniref:TonB-dependent receptor n=1 Tax=Phenylobacterium sp. TaxID=1871053 RepID=UPI002F4086DB
MAVATAAAAPAHAADSAAPAAVGELVVTAQRREENLVDVPISVSVVGALAMKNANYSNLTDLQFIAPSVSYNTNFGGGFEIRGVGTQSVTASVEQSVSVVIDDVVHGLPEISFAGPSYQALTDIERIEVLRGPQGTLFGKNSSAGVLQIVTTRPHLGEVSGDTSVSYGTDNELKLTANLNAPIGSTAAVRLSGFGYRRDGFVHNLYTHQDVSGYDNYGVRGKFLWQPNEKAEVYVIGSYVANHDDGNGIWTIRSCGSGFKGGLGVFSPCAEVAKYGVVPGPKNLSGAWDGLLGVKSIAREVSGRVSYDFGFATLKSITAYQNVSINEDVEVDSSPLPILSVNHSNFYNKEFTQEFRLDGKIGDRLDYTTGLFYYNTDVLYPGLQAGTYNYLPPTSPILLTSGVGGPVPCCTTITQSWTTSEAVFGEVNYHLLNNLVLIGGLRYTHDRNSLENHAIDTGGICQFAFALGGPCKPAVGLPSPKLGLGISDNNLTGKATIQYYVTPRFNFYATYSTGAKGPSVSYPRGLPLVPVASETSKNYEAGLKGSLLDGKLFVAADVFHTKYDNFQGQALYVDPANPGNRGYITTNAGGLETKGAEGEVTYRATPELTLTASVAYAPTRFTQFAIPCNDGYTNPATTPGKCTFINPRLGQLQFDAAGYPLTYAPKWTYSLSASWVHPIGDADFSAALNYHWQDEIYTVVADPNSIAPAYGLMGLNISYGPHDEHWRLSLFARNLLNQYFVSGIFKTSLDSGTANSTPLSTIGYANIPSIESKRTVGVKAEMRF